MAKIRKHKGKLVVDWYDSNKKRHIERIANREAGKQRLAEILKTGEHAPTTMTFKQYGNEWLENAKGHLAAGTYEEYEAVLRNHVYPTLGDKLFCKVTNQMIRGLIVAKRTEGYEPATIRNILAPVRGMYNQAIEDGEPVGNPAAKFGKQNRGRQKTIINPFTKEEVTIFLKKTLELRPELYPLYLCAVRTGMRRGELLALRRSDIDFDGRFIHVRRSFSRGKLKAPKSGKTRLVDMSKQLAAVLRELPGEMDAPLFPCDSTTNLYKTYRKHLADCGLRLIRFHDLRHTFATLHIKNNQPLPYIRDQLGHSSITVTCDLYGHLVPGWNTSAADLLDD